MSKKIEFKTFRDLTQPYFVTGNKIEEASFVNTLNYKRYKVTVEELEEPNEIYIERLEKILENPRLGFRRKGIVNNLINNLKK